MASQDESLFEEKGGGGADGPVECLGLTFANDDERRAYFTELLREKLKDPEFRAIEGFPIGEDEDILALSDPPYYTACPNPWLADFVKHYGKPYDPETDEYQREPFAADVSEGKNDPIYNAHSYHTKVPHKAIMRYILHYTEPGDIVYDGFCGTGMTGVAAQLCGDRKTVESLGFTTKADGTIVDEVGVAVSKLGARRAILNDLSPAATFIAHNYNSPINVAAFQREAKRILSQVEEESGWLYLTLHEPTEEQLQQAIRLLNNSKRNLKDLAPDLPWAMINFTVWSDVFLCPECGADNLFWEVAVDSQKGAVRDGFSCHVCGATMTKRTADRLWTDRFDALCGETLREAVQRPALVNYTGPHGRVSRSPNTFDLRLAELAARQSPGHWVPASLLQEGDKMGDLRSLGITHVHQMYTRRNLAVLASVWHKLSCASPRYRFWFSSALTWTGRENRLHLSNFFGGGGGPITSLRGTWYIASLSVETNVLERLRLRTRAMAFRGLMSDGLIALETCSATAGSLPQASMDYIFIDPPFGSNLMYSELNVAWESWINVRTNIIPEAIENRSQSKGLPEYRKLMSESFARCYGGLKPGKWITLEFHNSRNSVWMAIQEALQSAGFVVADVRTLAKGKGSFNQVNAAGAVKQDLVISAYKPRVELETQFELERGSADGAWTFIREHLRQLPVSVEEKGNLETVAERQAYLLYDRMVAFHVQRGVQVPLSAAGFYAGLDQRFPCRDGMYFLPEQVAEYDKKRLQAQEVRQLELFVTDEESAIQWLRQTLSDRPLTFQDLHPLFMREIAGWEKHEKALELEELLKENFVLYDGAGEVPSQIHAYLSSNFREMRGLAKDDPTLRAKAKGRWYLPDPRKAGDLEQLRERTLLREFDEYAAGKGKLKPFRIEAVRAGFKRAWQERDYKTIISVAERLPQDVLQEDAKLLMWYDQALTRAGE